MILKVFTVFDTKAGAYLPPFFYRSTGEALRAFSATVNDPSTNLGRYPADYTLFELGTFSDEDGSFSAGNAKVNLGNGLEFVDTDPPMMPALP